METDESTEGMTPRKKTEQEMLDKPEPDPEVVEAMGADSKFAMDDEQAKKIWDGVTAGSDSKMTACIKAMQGKVEDPGALCNWMAQKNGYDPNKQ